MIIFIEIIHASFSMQPFHDDLKFKYEAWLDFPFLSALSGQNVTIMDYPVIADLWLSGTGVNGQDYPLEI